MEHPTERHARVRVRHELRRRTLTVTAVEAITPRMRRVHLHSPELADFRSDGYDDHLKIFLPTPAGPVMRDFTPRRFDRRACTLTLDFALHEAGPAARWIAGAKVGDRLEIGGPRGSNIVPDDFDWYVLIGDETALPAIGRRVEELRASVPVYTFVAIADADERQTFSTAALWKPTWFLRGAPHDGDGADIALQRRRFRPPPGEGYVFLAGEASFMRALRAVVTDDWRHPSEWFHAAGYWQRGAPAEKAERGGR